MISPFFERGWADQADSTDLNLDFMLGCRCGFVCFVYLVVWVLGMTTKHTNHTKQEIRIQIRFYPPDPSNPRSKKGLIISN